MFSVVVSNTFRKQFKVLSGELQSRVRGALKELKSDPFKSRPGADIRPLKDTKPLKHRLRVGDYRIVYLVEGKVVKIIELFRRGRGYR